MKGLAPLHAVALAMCTAVAAIAATAPVLLRAQGASDTDIASAGVCASIGTVGGALWAGRRPTTLKLLTIALLLLLLAACVLAVSPVIHPLARGLDGAALGVGLVACETLLLRSSSARARTLALYTLATAAGWALGPLLAAVLASWWSPAGLAVAAVAAVVALLVTQTGHHQRPDEHTAAPLHTSSMTSVVRRNIAACATTLHFGAFQAALLVVLPLHLLRQGHDGRFAMIAVSAFALGMCAFTLANTQRGERHGPVAVMQALCVVGGVAVVGTGLLSSSSSHGLPWLALVFVAGATLATLSPLSLLLLVRTNDAGTLGPANAAYNAHYAVGLAVGPAIVAAVIDDCSTSTLLVVMGGAWMLHACFIALTAPPASVLPVSASGVCS